MTTNSTNSTNSTASLSVSERDRLAATYRTSGMSWAAIASLLGMANESSARTAGNRHLARVGAAHGYVAPPSGGRRARRVRHRGFGVEIEFVGATIPAVARAISDALGVHVHTTGYHGRSCSLCGGRINLHDWKVETDGSVTSGGVGGEVVTPPLSGPDGLDKLKIVMRAMRAAGATVDTRCGLHVHVAADGMTNAARANVVRTLYRHHDVLDRLVAPSRRNNRYCVKPSAVEVDRWASNMEATGSFGPGDKYRSVNIAPFARIGTIEVRYHHGTLNGRKAGAWVSLLVALFDAAAADATGDLAPGLALLGSLADAGRIDHSTAAYLMNRADTLARR